MKKFLLLNLLLLVFVTSYGQNTSDMLEGILPSVVTVGVYKTQPLKQLMGIRGDGTFSDVAYRKALNMIGVQTSGSGFIVQKNGKMYVITNAHVVENAASDTGSIKIYAYDRQQYNVSLIGGDNFYDIAVLEITQRSSNLKAVSLRNTETRIGETVFAVGNPLGRHPYSVMNGIISAKNRIVNNIPGYLQSSATLSGGNSGGPLFDAKGSVVGINTSKGLDPSTRQVQPQINYALNALIIDRIVTDILENSGRVNRVYLGLELVQKTTVERYERDTFSGESQEETTKVLSDKKPIISSIIENSPAARLLADYVGYTLEKINNEPIESLPDALIEFEKLIPNTTITLTISKDFNTKTFSFKTGILDTKALEDIANHAIGKRLDKIALSTNQSRPAFTIRAKGVYTLSKSGEFQPQPRYDSDDIYYIVAGGYFYNETNKELYEIKSMSAIGAALRLSSLLGVFDIVVLKKGFEKPELLHLNLSGKEDILQQTLWN